MCPYILSKVCQFKYVQAGPRPVSTPLRGVRSIQYNRNYIYTWKGCLKWNAQDVPKRIKKKVSYWKETVSHTNRKAPEDYIRQLIGTLRPIAGSFNPCSLEVPVCFTRTIPLLWGARLSVDVVLPEDSYCAPRPFYQKNGGRKTPVYGAFWCREQKKVSSWMRKDII